MVRKVSNKNRRYTNMIGSFYSAINNNGIQYESLTELAVLRNLECNHHEVKSYTVQEIPVPVFVQGEQTWIYTPDIFVEYKSGLKQVIEVKKTKADAETKVALIKKHAGEQFCEKNGWIYSVITQEDIDPTEMKNLKFIFGFRNRIENHHVWGQLILELVRGRTGVSISEIREFFGSIEVIPVIYYMIFSGELGTDLTKPITLKSIVNTNGGLSDANKS